MKNLEFKLPLEVMEKLEAIAKIAGVKVSTVVKVALTKYLLEQEDRK